MIKQQVLTDPNSCLNKAGPGEPLFVLRAKDPAAAQAVRHWATMASGEHDDRKIAAALAVADAMDDWRKANVATPAPSGLPVNRA